MKCIRISVRLIAIFALHLGILSGCSICVNGAGIGCGGPREVSFEEEEREAKKTERKAQELVNNTMIKRLAAGLGAYIDREGRLAFAAELDQLGQRKLEAELNYLVKALYDASMRYLRSPVFRSHFDVVEKDVRMPSIKLTPRGLSPEARCGLAQIDVPIPLLKTLIAGAVRSGGNPSATQQALVLNKSLSEISNSFPGGLGPAVTQILQDTTEANTAVYRALLFAIGHELGHAASKYCQPSNEPIVQERKEQKADLFASLIASNVYSKSCLKDPFLVTSPALDAVLDSSPPSTKRTAGKALMDQLTISGRGEFLVGGSGDVAFLFKTVTPSVDEKASSHPLPGLRDRLDSQTREKLAREFFNGIFDEAKGSLASKLFMSSDDWDRLVVMMDYRQIPIYITEYVAPDSVRCTSIRFKRD